MEPTDKQIEDLIARLDSFMEEGGGHMEVHVANENSLETVKVTTTNTSECRPGKSACSIPTAPIEPEE